MARFHAIQKENRLSNYRVLGLIVAGITLALAITSIILSVSAATTLYSSVRESEKSQKQYDLASDLLVDVLDMETGVRGYVINNDPVFLEPYDNALQKIEMHMELIAAQSDGTIIEELTQCVNNARDYFARAVEARRFSDLDAAKASLDDVHGKKEVDRVRDLVVRLQSQGMRRYAEIVDETNQSFQNAIYTAIASGICVLSFILFYLGLTRYYNASLLKQASLANASEKNYRTLIDNAPIGILQIDLQGRITESNKLVSDLLSNDRDRLIGSNIVDFVAVDDIEGFLQKYRGLISGERDSLSWKHKLVDSSGSPIWILNAISLLRDDQGKPSSVVSAIVDERDQRETEVVRRQMAAIVNGSNDAVVSKTVDGMITLWNPAAEELFGFSRDEIIGSSILRLIPEELHQEELDMRTKCLSGEIITPFRTTRLDKEGNRIEVLLNVMPLFDTDGASLGMCSIIKDLTVEMRAAAELQESESRFQMLADNISHLAWIANEEGWITWYNKRWYDYTGTTLEEMKGWGWTKVHHPEHVDRVVSHIGDCWKTGTPWEDTFPLRGKDGRYRWFLSRAIPIRDQRGRIKNWFGSNTDITELIENEESLKRARTQAEDANRARGEFLANMSHEIRTPMTAILGHSDILADHIKDPDDIQSIETIRRSSKYLLQIINDILDLSKIDSGKLKTEVAEFSLPTLLQEIKSLLDVRASEKQIGFSVSIDGSIPKVIKSDPIRQRQVLVNLAGNAIKFTDRGNVDLICSADIDSKKVRFAISDSGIGIPADMLERIFQPFVQADASSTRAFEGTGLGLAISKRLAQALGGDITVQSQVGIGSVFTLEINCTVGLDDEWVSELIPIEERSTTESI